jgi:hypothetical protein
LIHDSHFNQTNYSSKEKERGSYKSIWEIKSFDEHQRESIARVSDSMPYNMPPFKLKTSRPGTNHWKMENTKQATELSYPVTDRSHKPMTS